MNQAKMGWWENTWYYLSVILSLGTVFTIKVIVKKAMIEAQGHSSETVLPMKIK